MHHIYTPQKLLKFEGWALQERSSRQRTIMEAVRILASLTFHPSKDEQRFIISTLFIIASISVQIPVRTHVLIFNYQKIKQIENSKFIGLRRDDIGVQIGVPM